MSNLVLPNIKGKGFDIIRTVIWNNTIQQTVSGKEVRVNNGWTYPKYQWDVTYNFLRSDNDNNEFQTLLSFYNTMRGNYDSFLYNDSDDNNVINQNIGSGNGVTTSFQLVKSFGSFVEPIYAPNNVTNVYVNGVIISNIYWTISNWGSSDAGLLKFVNSYVPANNSSITVDFSYYFPCRFSDDKVSFNNFMSQLWDCKKLSFVSIK